MISSAQATWIVARKEILEHVRSKRIFIIGGLFLLTFLLAAIFGYVLTRDSDFDSDQAITTVLAFYFSIGFVGGFTFVAVLGITLSADAIVGEWKDRSLFLLFSKPLTRNAVLAGKILGAYLSVILVCVLVFTACLLLMLALLGVPPASELGRIVAGFGVVLIGVLPFVALGIFCSTWTRTPATSFVIALGLWLLVFPILGAIGFILDFTQGGFQAFAGEGEYRRIFSVLSPNALIQNAVNVWTGGDGRFFGEGVFAADEMHIVILAMLVHTCIYLGLSFWIINRRDYA